MQRMYDSKEKVSYVNVEDHLEHTATSQDTGGFVLVICQLPRSTIQEPRYHSFFYYGWFQGSRFKVCVCARVCVVLCVRTLPTWSTGNIGKT